jgi:hypothetical protein
MERTREKQNIHIIEDTEFPEVLNLNFDNELLITRVYQKVSRLAL